MVEAYSIPYHNSHKPPNVLFIIIAIALNTTKKEAKIISATEFLKA